MKNDSKVSHAADQTSKPRLSLKKATIMNLNVQTGVRAGRAAANPRTDCVCHCNPL